jgi:hypothetical protein
MLGGTEGDVKADIIPAKEGGRPWALLNDARSLQGKFNHLIVS